MDGITHDLISFVLQWIVLFVWGDKRERSFTKYWNRRARDFRGKCYSCIYGIFPIQISKRSFLLNVVSRKSNKEVFLASFFKKAAIIRKLGRGESMNLQAVRDVPNKHHAFSQPNAINIYGFCGIAERIMLIILTNFSFQIIRKWIEDFRRGVEKTMFLFIYNYLVPVAVA